MSRDDTPRGEAGAKAMRLGSKKCAEKAEMNFRGVEFCRESSIFNRGVPSKNKKGDLILEPVLTAALRKSGTFFDVSCISFLAWKLSQGNKVGPRLSETLI